MDFQTFSFDALPWMKAVCYESFEENVFLSYSEFDLLYDKDFGDNFVVGFSVLSSLSVSMGDLVVLNKICGKHHCFYRLWASNDCLSINFYLENA